MKKKQIVHYGTVILMVSVLFLKSAFSFGTIEQFDQQNGYFSVDLGVDKVRRNSVDSKVDGSAIFGKGLNNFISAYMGVKVQGNKFFSDGNGGFFLGTFASLYSFDHFALDVVVEAGLINGYFYAKPGLEINFDLAPDHEFMGLYLNVNEELTGVDTSWETDDTATLVDESTPKHVFVPETELNIGYYFSLLKGQQFHICLDQRFRNNPLFNQKVYYIDALKFGYNIMIKDGFQLQTEFDYHIAQYNEKSKFGFRIGLVKW